MNLIDKQLEKIKKEKRLGLTSKKLRRKLEKLNYSMPED